MNSSGSHGLRGPGSDLRPAVVLGALLVGFTLFRFEHHPFLFPDEAINMAVSADLAREGVQPSPRSMLFDPLITTGPTVTLPLAVVFKLLGVGVAQARAVMSLHMAVAVVGLGLLAAHAFGRRAGLLAVAFLVVDDDLYYWGKAVEGEVAALGMFWLGALALSHALSIAGGAGKMAALSGVLFALSGLTKPQMLMMLPALGVYWLVLAWLARFEWKVAPEVDIYGEAPDASERGHRVRVAVALVLGGGAVAAMWLGALLPSMGLSGVLQYLREFFFAQPHSRLAAEHVVGNVRYLLSGPHSVGIGLAAICYQLAVLASGGPRRGRWRRGGLPLCFVLVMLAWFVVSVGGKMVLPAKLTMYLFIGAMLDDLLPKRPWLSTWRSPAGMLTGFLLVAAAVTTVGSHFGNRDRDTGVYTMAAHVDANLPAGASVESYEAELYVLANRSSMYGFVPPLSRFWWGEQRRVGPPYRDFVVEGMSSRYLGLYSADFLSHYEPVFSVGEFALYRLRKETGSE